MTMVGVMGQAGVRSGLMCVVAWPVSSSSLECASTAVLRGLRGIARAGGLGRTEVMW